MSRKTILMSPADSKIYNFFEKQFSVIESDYLQELISYERYHADMQVLNLNGTLFVNGNCKNLISKLNTEKVSFTECNDIGYTYPKNVALNAAFTGKFLICNQKYLHPKVQEYCERNDIKTIRVKQGYAKCSTLILNETTIVTDDDSIAKASDSYGLNVLKIDKGDIFLDENNIGFIGGASAVIGKTVYFFGDINKHRNSREIIEYIKTFGLEYLSVDSERLSDLGGIVEIY